MFMYGYAKWTIKVVLYARESIYTPYLERNDGGPIVSVRWRIACTNILFRFTNVHVHEIIVIK